jgi:tryptophan synthase beta chain
VPAEREKLAAKFGGELGCGAQLSDILSLQRKDGGVTTVFMRGSIEAVENGSCEFRGVMTEAGELAKAIAVLQDEAEKCRETGEAKTIVFGLTGTGYFDLVAYEKYHDGKMDDYIPTDEELEASFKQLPQI